MERALRLPLPMIGINNLEMHSFEVSLETTIKMLDMIPDDRIIITESGILGKEDVAKMRGHAVNIFLVGEAFMRAENPGEKLAELFASISGFLYKIRKPGHIYLLPVFLSQESFP